MIHSTGRRTLLEVPCINILCITFFFFLKPASSFGYNNSVSPNIYICIYVYFSPPLSMQSCGAACLGESKSSELAVHVWKIETFPPHPLLLKKHTKLWLLWFPSGLIYNFLKLSVRQQLSRHGSCCWQSSLSPHPVLHPGREPFVGTAGVWY